MQELNTSAAFEGSNRNAVEATNEATSTSTTVATVVPEPTIMNASSTDANTAAAASDFSLPADYLSRGYLLCSPNGKSTYPDPALNDAAKVIGLGLASAGVKSQDYLKIFRELKKARKSTLPIEAQIGALVAQIPKAMLLEKKKRVPHALVELLERNRHAVVTYKDYCVCIDHLQAVGVYLDLGQPESD